MFKHLKDQRMDESRLRLVNAFFFALGAYDEQESKKEDQWRDQTWWQLVKHIAHEVEELKRSDTRMKLLHNLCDLVMLADILLATAMDESGYFSQENSFRSI